eukprot:scaffold14.g1050.t1
MEGSSMAGAQLGGEPSAFDYTFTDKELHDLLGYMERQQSTGRVAAGEGQQGEAQLPFLPSAGSLSLQFQPHPSPLQQQQLVQLAQLPGGEGMVMKPEPELHDVGVASRMLAATQLGPSGPCLPLLPTLSLGGASPAGTPGTQLVPVVPLEGLVATQEEQQEGAASPDQRHQNGRARPPQHGHAARREAKPHISHSIVEKQRRDRINSLIDELRELVPPQHHEGPHDMHDGRRAKHVVLSDAIFLIKDLQQQLAARSCELVDLPLEQQLFIQQQQQLAAAAGPPPPPAPPPQQAHDSAGASSHGGGSAPSGSYHHTGSPSRERSSSTGSGLDPELPHATAEAEVAVVRQEVVVEDAGDSLYVRVHAHDRHGLLADILRALKGMPLEITTAAVTTTREGGVYDVFQLVREEGVGPPPDRGAIARAVEEAVFAPDGALFDDGVGCKRRHG